MAKNNSGAPTGGPNLTIVGGAVDKAKPAPKVGEDPRDELDDSPELPLLDPGCLVEPLGKLGQICYYLDEQKQLIGLDPQKHGKQHIRNLFGRKSYLCDQYWPRYSDKEDAAGNRLITGWKPEIAADLLMRACAMAGLFDPQGKVRGTGAHRANDGELVLHCGDQIVITGHERGPMKPGRIGGFVYPAGPSRPRPDPSAQGSAPAELLLSKLQLWNWSRPLVDPMLLLGWIGCAMIGGALTWRPHAWITGSSATGKSTLQNLLRALFEDAALTTGNATEASLRQLLKQQTLPVFFDELEAAKDNRKAQAVIELARVASSGDVVLRGGQDHQGAEFIVRSCFLFSSILLPPMMVQDKNRLAILELERIPPGKTSPPIVPVELNRIGRQLRRRLVDHWHRLGEQLDRYKTALADVGHGGRSQDQFGALLAVADLLLYDVADESVVLEWADKLRADTLAEKATELDDEQEAVQFLSSSFLRQRGGEEPEPISRTVRAAIGAEPDKARDRLENFGLRIVEKTETGARAPSGKVPNKELYLAIADCHVALGQIFQDTRWSDGTWQQSFGRVEGAHRRVKVRFAGAVPQWSTLIPLTAILDFRPDAP